MAATQVQHKTLTQQNNNIYKQYNGVYPSQNWLKYLKIELQVEYVTHFDENALRA